VGHNFKTLDNAEKTYQINKVILAHLIILVLLVSHIYQHISIIKKTTGAFKCKLQP